MKLVERDEQHTDQCEGSEDGHVHDARHDHAAAAPAVIPGRQHALGHVLVHPVGPDAEDGVREQRGHQRILLLHELPHDFRR